MPNTACMLDRRCVLAIFRSAADGRSHPFARLGGVNEQDIPADRKSPGRDRRHVLTSDRRSAVLLHCTLSLNKHNRGRVPFSQDWIHPRCDELA